MASESIWPNGGSMVHTSIETYTFATARNLNDISKPFYIFYSFALVVITMVGCVGNIMVVGAVLTDKKLWKENNLFILNLAVADFSVAIFVVPFSLAGVFVGHAWFLEHPMLCHASGAICLIACACSLWTIATISLNRFVLLCHENYYHRIFTWHRSLFIILGLWLTAICLDLPNFLGWGDHSYDMKTMTCSYDRTADYSYTIFFVLLFVTIPLVVVVYSNINIYMFVLHSRKRIVAHQETRTHQESSNTKKQPSTNQANTVSQCVIPSNPDSPPLANTKGNSGEAPLGQPDHMVKPKVTVKKEDYQAAPVMTYNKQKQSNIWREVKLAKTLFIIFLVFCICWAPYGVICLYDRYDHVDKDWYVMSVLFAHSSSMLNSILYGATNKGFRDGYKTFLQTCGCKWF